MEIISPTLLIIFIQNISPFLIGLNPLDNFSTYIIEKIWKMLANKPYWPHLIVLISTIFTMNTEKIIEVIWHMIWRIIQISVGAPYCGGGSVAERLERWTCNLNARSSIPTNDRQLDLFVVVPSSTPQPH